MLYLGQLTSNRKYIGNGYTANGNRDWAVFEKDSSYPFTDYIRDPSGDVEVASHFTRSGVKDLMDNAKQVWKQGTSTGLETGHIYRMDVHVFGYQCTDFYGGIETACNTASGDSGGPVYANSSLSYGDVSIISTHVAHQSTNETGNEACGNTVYSAELGTPAYKMSNDGGIDFTT